VWGANTLVEGNGGAEQGVDDVGVVVQLLVDHQGKDAHLGGAAVVELDGLLLVKVEAGGDGGDVGAELLASIDDVLLAKAEAELEGTDEKHHLGEAGGGDGVEGGKASLHLGEGKAGGDVTTAADAGSGHDVAEDGKLRDAAVLVLDVSEAVESLLVGVLEEAKRIPEAKGSLGADGCEGRGAREGSVRRILCL
jgi:hypothetical protein